MASMPTDQKELPSIFSAYSYTPVTILKKTSGEKPKRFVGRISAQACGLGMMRIAALGGAFCRQSRHLLQSLPATGFRVILSAFNHARSRLSPSN